MYWIVRAFVVLGILALLGCRSIWKGFTNQRYAMVFGEPTFPRWTYFVTGVLLIIPFILLLFIHLTQI